MYYRSMTGSVNAARFGKYTDGETAVKFLEQNIRLNSMPKTIGTDKATAFTGRLFRDFCKKEYIKFLYGTPYIHYPTGNVEQGFKKLKGNLLTDTKPCERIGEAPRSNEKNTTYKTEETGIRTPLLSKTKHENY